MKIVFMGTPDFAVEILTGLADSKNEIGYVVTQPDKAKNRGKKIQYTPVKEKALLLGVPVLQPSRVRGDEDFYNKLKDYNPDIIVVAAYGQLLPKEILELPKYGCINVHASLLPKLRGASPIQHAIIQGMECTGVTIMQMAEGLDTGDMLSSVRVNIDGMNYSQLHDKLAKCGSKLLINTIEMIKEGHVTPVKQKDEESSYARLIYKQDGKMDFEKEPEEIERLVRGLDPWPGAFCLYNELQMKVWHCYPINEESKTQNGTIVKVDNNGIKVSCGGKYLLIDQIQVPGKKRVEVRDYLRGNSIQVGTVLV